MLWRSPPPESLNRVVGEIKELRYRQQLLESRKSYSEKPRFLVSQKPGFSKKPGFLTDSLAGKEVFNIRPSEAKPKKRAMLQTHDLEKIFPKLIMTYIPQHHLPTGVNQLLLEKLSSILADLDNITEVTLARLGKAAKQHLPQEILQSLTRLKQSQGLPFSVIRNLPVDENPGKPPADGKRSLTKATNISEKILLAMCAAAGFQPVAYQQEKGVLVHEITPVAGKEESLSNEGRTSLGFHTDDSILKACYRPEFLFLLGLVNQPETPTYIAVLDEALQELSPRHQQLLEEPLFRVEAPQSFNLWNGKVIQSEWRSLITRNSNGEAEIAGNLYALVTKTKEAQTALDALSDVLPHVAKEVILQPGDMLLFDNAKCLHGRAAVSKTGDRWLQRVFCRRSLTDLRRATGSNNSFVFDIKFLVLE